MADKKLNLNVSDNNKKADLLDTIFANMRGQAAGNTATGIMLTGDPGVGKCLTGENRIELFVNDEQLLKEIQEFLNEQR
jgi:hypothetical protein